MSEAAMLEFDPAAIAPPMRGSKKKKKKEASSPKRKKAIPEVQAPVPQAVDAPSADETSLIPPNGVPGEVCLGIRVNVEEFKKDFSSGDRLHGVKVDWSTVDLSQATNTVSYEREMAARRELFRMRVRMDGRLVETMDPDEMEKSQKGKRPRKRKRRLASEKADGVPSTDNSLPQETPPVRVNPSAPANTSGVATGVTCAMIAAMKSVVERTQKGKEKVSEAPADLEDVRMGKTALSLSRADQYKEPTIGSPTGQTSGRGSNQPVTSENPVDGRICSIGVLEESASNLATNTMSHITLVLEEHKRVRRLHAELEERLAEIEKKNLALNNKAHTLEAEKQRMTDRVALMSRPDLYELLEAKLDGFQLANHAGVVGNFENLTLTLTRKWTAIPGLNLDRFEQCPDEYPDFASYAEKWNGWKEHCSLCTSSLGFLPSINTGVCQHNFHFTCFWKYASTRRLCPICRTALPDATYEFFCTIFVPQGTDSINPNTGETVTMVEDVERKELVGGRGHHVTRNESRCC
ncbi:hypothetical protein R1sor_003231 [Riccia sorocarpa]|uniref:RING-type domain-containing protein n=1 Tax=Riccia sorocarpa TaxID=122646 RepID=A0ABD3H4X0_9MARC